MQIWIARENPRRRFLYIPTEGTGQNPSLMIQMEGVSKQHLDELVRKQLEMQGVTKESDVHTVIERAEKGFEYRRKVKEATIEVRRLMKLKEEGLRLMSVGNKKWVPVFYPAPKQRES